MGVKLRQEYAAVIYKLRGEKGYPPATQGDKKIVPYDICL